MNALTVFILIFLIGLALLGVYLWLQCCSNNGPTPYPYTPGASHHTVVPISDEEAYREKKSAAEEKVRAIQEELINETRMRGPPTSTTLVADLIIGVDATPKRLGGYLLNLKKGSVEFYSFPIEKLPWTLSPSKDASGNSSESEMKNLHFALLLWEQKVILGGQRVRVYTDNSEYMKKKTDYGPRVSAYVRHLNQCKGGNIQVEVRGTVGNWIVDHAKFVKPADEFSRKKFADAKKFLVDYFGIKEAGMEGSHRVELQRRGGNNFVKWDVPCDAFYQEMLRKVRNNHDGQSAAVCRKPTCPLRFMERSLSLQSIVSTVV